MLKTRWRFTACLLAMTLWTACASQENESAPAMLLEGRESGEVTENGAGEDGRTADGRSEGDAGSDAGRDGSPGSTAENPSNGVVQGEQAAVSKELAQTVAGLCVARSQASTDPEAAKATYARSSARIETATRALRPSYSLAASNLTEARALVEADLATDPPRRTLFLNLGLLTERMREGLARLGIRSSPCPK